jgi:hypothetical protein
VERKIPPFFFSPVRERERQKVERKKNLLVAQKTPSVSDFTKKVGFECDWIQLLRSKRPNESQTQ